jgi:hypothetical protein
MRWTLPPCAAARLASLAASPPHGLAMPAPLDPTPVATSLPAAARLWPSLLLGTPDSAAVRAWRGLARGWHARLTAAVTAAGR